MPVTSITQVVECGFKYNMMDMQAAIGIHQLARVETAWLRREHIWNYYNAQFGDLPIGLPEPVEIDTRHAYHLYTIGVDSERTGISRDDFLDAMNARGIGTGVHYLSLPEHPYYQQNMGWRPEAFPHATRIGRQTVSLPISPKLATADTKRVAAAVRGVLAASVR